ncbi:MAG: GNAT family N-acetyltransferase [Bacteroidota bacterium]
MYITKALTSDAKAITELTLRSKNHWNYGEAQIEAWYDELEVSEAFIQSNAVYKLLYTDQIAGFYAYTLESSKAVLEFLFIEPEFIGKGIGKALMEHFIKKMHGLKVDSITLDADPHAEGFYQKFGFVTVDQRSSTIAGRFLPVMQLQLTTKINNPQTI